MLSHDPESAFQTILDQIIKGDWKLITQLAVDLKDLQDGHETVNKPLKERRDYVNLVEPTQE